MRWQFHTPPRTKLNLPYAQTKLTHEFHWNKKPVENCNFLGFCSGIAEDYVILGYDTTTMRNQTVMFWSDMVSQLQGLKCPKRIGHFGKDNKMDTAVLGDEEVTLLNILMFENEDIRLLWNVRSQLPMDTIISQKIGMLNQKLIGKE